MSQWMDLGGGWSWTLRRHDGQPRPSIWLRHRCPDGIVRTAVSNGHHTIVSLDPLHLEPSVRCGCGAHGWVRDGRWQPIV